VKYVESGTKYGSAYGNMEFMDQKANQGNTDQEKETRIEKEGAGTALDRRVERYSPPNQKANMIIDETSPFHKFWRSPRTN
jgi:hypothetical protein